MQAERSQSRNVQIATILQRTLAINKSKSNQRYSFQKAQRFQEIRANSQVLSYMNDNHQYSTVSHKPPKEAGFGTQIKDRFEYPEQKIKALHPSPSEYKISRVFDNHGGMSTQNSQNSFIRQTEESRMESPSRIISTVSKQYSFGVGRDRMLPLHVDQVVRKSQKFELPPGPGQYEPPKTFGNAGLKQSLGSRLSYEDIQLKKKGFTPGPGSYEFEDKLIDKFTINQIEKARQQIDTIIQGNKNRSGANSLSKSVDKTYTYSLNSRKENPKGTILATGEPRFKMDKLRLLVPGPGNYNPRQGMADNSIVYRSAIGGKIGTAKLDIFEIKNHLREKKLVPGPGAYPAFSEFNQTIA